MIAPPVPRVPGLEPCPDILRANQLIEAGLWLHLGGNSEGAHSLFQRALTVDPSNRRAREWLSRTEADLPRAPSGGEPVVLLPEASEWESPVRSEVQVSVVLLDEAALMPRSDRVPSAEVVVLEDEEAFSPDTLALLAERRQGVVTLLIGVEEMLTLGDTSSALALLDKAEGVAPGDPRLAEARERCVREQQGALEARLGNLKQVPLLKLRMAELMKLSLDARTGFLLSRIDGQLSYEALFSVSGMSRLDTLRTLVRLWDQDILTVR